MTHPAFARSDDPARAALQGVRPNSNSQGVLGLLLALLWLKSPQLAQALRRLVALWDAGQLPPRAPMADAAPLPSMPQGQGWLVMHAHAHNDIIDLILRDRHVLAVPPAPRTGRLPSLGCRLDARNLPKILHPPLHP